MPAADAGPTASGPEATYVDALPGVSVAYAAQGSSVKESIVLDSAAAPSRYSFAVDASSGLRPRERSDGSIDWVDAESDVVFSWAAPFMSEAGDDGAVSRDVHFALGETATGWKLDVVADGDWLAKEGRRFPVTIDPTTVVTGAVDDCAMVGGTQAGAPYCGYSDPTLAMGTHGNGDPRRVFMKFDTSAVPRDAVVVNADLALSYRTGSPRPNMDLHQVTSSSTSARTWNTYDGTSAWTTPGGDIDPAPAATTPNPNTTPGWRHWYPTELVQQWVDGRAANNGMILKDRVQPAPLDVIVFDSSEAASNKPYLQILWNKGGIRSQYHFFEEQLTDRSKLMANVASGNLILQENDVNINGTAGFNATYSRFYNSRTAIGGPGDAYHWNNSTVPCISQYGNRENVVLYIPSYAPVVFIRRADGTYKAPTAFEAQMVYVPSTATVPDHYDLTFNRSQEKWHFTGAGIPTRMEDRNGNHVDWEVNGPNGMPSALIDTQGRRINIAYDATNRVQSVSMAATTNAPARTWQYAYTGSLHTSYTNADGKTTQYYYNPSTWNLERITDPRGNTTAIGYDNNLRVTSIKRVTDPTTSSGPTTFFEYDATETQCPTGRHATRVTDSRGNQTDYCSDEQLRVTEVIDAKGNSQSAQYNANSNVTQTNAPGAPPATFTYDAAFNPRIATDATGANAERKYNGPEKFQPSDSTNEQGTKFAYAYDAPGNLTAVTNGASPTQIEAKLDYNPDGTIDKAHDGNGHTTDYTYLGGNLTEVTPPAITPAARTQLGKTSFENDGLSRVKKVWDGLHPKTASTSPAQKIFTYDAMDRVTKIDFADGTWVCSPMTRTATARLGPKEAARPLPRRPTPSTTSTGLRRRRCRAVQSTRTPTTWPEI